MRAAALLLCFAQQDLEATLVPSRSEVAIGEPVEWTLTVEHDRDESLRLLQPELAPDASWVQVAGPRTARVRAGDGARTTVRWELMSLEPGERALPVPGFELTSGAAVSSTPGSIVVRGELAPGEDAPRGLAAPHPAPPRAGGGRWLAWTLLGVWLLSSALTTVLLVRGGRRRTEEHERAADLLGELGAPRPGEQRAWTFRYATLLRAACDEALDALGASHAADTDEEWLARQAAAGALPGPLQDELRAALACAAEVKFGGVELTPFALDALRERAARVLAGLPGGPRPLAEEDPS
jgi:hypothetical protein